MGYAEDRFRERMAKPGYARAVRSDVCKWPWVRLGISREAYERKLREGEKWCRRCETWWQRSAFHREAARKDGRNNWCKACHAGRKRCQEIGAEPG